MYIEDKNVLREVLAFEQKQYKEVNFRSEKDYFWARLFNHPACLIMKWQKYSRLADFYAHACIRQHSIFNLLRAKYYAYFKQKYANKCGFEINTSNIGRGFLIFHAGSTVINRDAVIGDNVHLHGNNCIGNGGETNLSCPVIGDNVKVGVGAKIVGGVTIGDNCYIGACALVNKSFSGGQVLVGVPARALPKDKG